MPWSTLVFHWRWRNLDVASVGRLPPVRAALANTLAELNAR
jgi:hypothetical protein